MISVPQILFNDPYCGGPGGVFNFFSITPVDRYKDYQFLSFDDQNSWTDGPPGDPFGFLGGDGHENPPGWVAASSFNPTKSAFVYNRRLGRLLIPYGKYTGRILIRVDSPNFFGLSAEYFLDLLTPKSWDVGLSNDMNSMYFGCGALNGSPYGYSYKLVFPSNPTGGSQNMSRGEKYYDMFQLGISQGFVDSRAEMYLKYVISDGQGKPINTNQDLYTPNCQTTAGSWSNFQYKMNSPLISYQGLVDSTETEMSGGVWYLSLNPLDWQTSENDPSRGLDNLKTFMGKYPALFTNGPSQQLSFAPRKQGWAHRNGKCLKVSDCLSGECSRSQQECRNKNKCPCMKSMESYSGKQSNHSWTIILVVVVGLLVVLGAIGFLRR